MPAPLMIPPEDINHFLLDGKMRFIYDYHDNTIENEEYKALIDANFTEATFTKYLEMAKNREENYYHKTDTWLWEAFKDFSVEGKKVLICGSANPWYEAVAIDQKVEKCTVIEYNKRESFHPKVVYCDFEDTLPSNYYDAIISISSFEHDGLGRYGDPLDPTADLKAMKNIKKLLKKDGKLFLSIPVGMDTLFFNSRRHYGNIRLPMLLEGWKVIKSYGLMNGWQGVFHYGEYQPVFVLEEENEDS